MKKFCISIVLSIVLAATAYGARSSVSSGSRSSGSRSSVSSPKPSSPKPSAPSVKPSTSAKPATEKSTKWGTSDSKSNSANASAAKTKTDVAAYEKAKVSGKAFGNRNEAVKDLQSKVQTHWDKEPAQRPSYVPNTVVDGGKSRTIIYNNSYGTYGYVNDSGSFVNMMATAVIVDSMLNHHGYYVGAVPSTQPVVHSGTSGWTILFVFVGIAVFIIIVIVVAKNYD